MSIDIEFEAWQRTHFASIMANMLAAIGGNDALSGMIQSAIKGAYMAGRAAIPPSTGVAAGWISVADRLPEWAARDDTPCIVEGRAVPPTLTPQTVLVALDGGGAVRTDKLTAIEGGTPWFDTYKKRVTHWMPTPATPQTAPRQAKEKP